MWRWWGTGIGCPVKLWMSIPEIIRGFEQPGLLEGVPAYSGGGGLELKDP